MPKPRPRRKPRTGSVYPRSGGGWAAQVSYIDSGGKRRFLTRWRRSESAAKAALTILLASVERDEPTEDTTHLEDFLARWIVDLGPSVTPATFQRYESIVRLDLALLGAMPIGRIRPDDVRRLIRDRLAAGKSPATVQLTVAVLRKALAQAVDDGIIERNPTTGVALPRIDREPIVALTPARARRIVEAVRGDELEALWLLLLGSGLRRGEALGLDWPDVDLDRATVRVRAGKTRASIRTVPVPAFVVAALRPRRAIAGSVFTGAHGRLTGNEVRHAWERVLRAGGLPPMRVHDLRHGTATLLLAQGTPMRVIADQLGHSNPSTTGRIYAHVIEEQQRAAIAGLDSLTKLETKSGAS